MPQHPKRDVSELTMEELRGVVRNIQELLWWDTDINDHEFWNADKAWSSRDEPPIVFVEGVLEVAGLKPIDLPTVQGFDCVEEFLEALPTDTPLPDDYGESEDPEDWTPHAKPSS